MGKAVFDEAELRRAHVVFEVQLGRKTIRDAARELGISPKHYYDLEAKALKSLMEALRPGRRGRRSRAQTEDPKLRELAAKVAELDREREILRLKIQDLEEVNAVIRHRIREQEGEKKARRVRPVSGHRKPVHGGMQGDASGGGEAAPGGGPERLGPMPEGRHFQGELRFMEAGEAPTVGETGTEGHGPRGRGGLPHRH